MSSSAPRGTSRFGVGAPVGRRRHTHVSTAGPGARGQGSFVSNQEESTENNEAGEVVVADEGNSQTDHLTDPAIVRGVRRCLLTLYGAGRRLQKSFREKDGQSTGQSREGSDPSPSRKRGREVENVGGAGGQATSKPYADHEDADFLSALEHLPCFRLPHVPRDADGDAALDAEMDRDGFTSDDDDGTEATEPAEVTTPTLTTDSPATLMPPSQPQPHAKEEPVDESTAGREALGGGALRGAEIGPARSARDMRVFLHQVMLDPELFYRQLCGRGACDSESVNLS